MSASTFFKKKLNYKSRCEGLARQQSSRVRASFAFRFHELHGLLFDCLDALRGAVLLLVLQVALEEELDLFHRNAQVDDAIEKLPARGTWVIF